MNIPDPRHAAATAPMAAPAAPQWGGQAPSVINPDLIAHLANQFFNAAPGQTVDPQALANFAVTQERPPAPPTSVPGAIAAAAAVPGTSVPGAQSIPFTSQNPSLPLDTVRAPAQQIPAAGLASGITSAPDAMAPLYPPAVLTAPSGIRSPEPSSGYMAEADLSAIPHMLGPAVALLPPSLHEHAVVPFPGTRPSEAFYFLDAGQPAQPGLSELPSVPVSVPGDPVPQAPHVTSFSRETRPSSLPGVAGAPAPHIEQPPSYGANFPAEEALRPQNLSELKAFPSATFPAGYSHATDAPNVPVSAHETHYFLSEAQAAGAIPERLAKPIEAPGATATTPKLEPLAREDLVSGTRAFDAYAIKRDFPILHQEVHGKPLIWLDNAATTQKPQAVIDRIALFYEHENSNIHRGAHALAARSTDAYEAAREKVRRFVGAGSPNDIVFTRGATEAINLVAQAWGRRNVHAGDEIVITWLEHHANIVPWQMLCADVGAVLKVAPVDDTGQVILEEYTKLLSPKTRIVSLPQVSNALGTVTPAQEMVAVAHRHGACVLVDGAQAVSHMPVNVQALDCDFYVFSGHKVFAPTGIGVLYGKPEVLAAMPPWQGGGNMIADVTFEKTIYQPPPGRFEAGTGNIADAVGLGAAIDYLDRIGMANIAAYEHGLLDYATQKLLAVPGLTIIGTAKEKAGVISFVLDGCRAEDVGVALDRDGIAVRAGHHCAQPILRRFGLEATVRPSLALYNTPEDIDALAISLHRIQTQKSYRAR